MTTALKLDYDYSFANSNLHPVEINPIDARAIELVHTFGWQDLPDSIIELIETDLVAYHSELNGFYCSRDEAVLSRRASVRYWAENYLDGTCSYDTAYQMLKVNN